jgi:hypothetical protein
MLTANQRKCMDWVAERLGITSHTDWSKITKDQIKSVGVLGLFSHYGSLSSVLERVYPGNLVTISLSY